MKYHTTNVLKVKYSYLMAKELSQLGAEIRQRHYEQQQTDSEYWEKDKKAQEADGVTPDPLTGVAVPVLTLVDPQVHYENGIPDHDAANEAFRAEAEANFAEDQADEEEVQKNGATISNMIKAAPKVLAALLQPSDSPMALARLKVCQGCEHWTGTKCRKCGCFTALKVRLPSEACPIGKWGKEE